MSSGTSDEPTGDPDSRADTDVWERPHDCEGQSSGAENVAGRAVAGRLAVFAVVCFAVFLMVRLGAVIVGQRILAGTDILSNLFPWSDGGDAIRPQNWQLGDSIDYTFPGYLDLRASVWSGNLTEFSSFYGPGRQLWAFSGLPVFGIDSVWWLLLPTAYAAGLVKLVQLVLAFVGMVLWLRRAGASLAAGTVAGVLYVGSGFLTAWSNWPAQTATACLIPALLWAVERLVQQRTLLAAVPVALIVGLMLLGGFPAVAGHALYAAGIYFLVRIVADRRGHSPFSDLVTLGWGIGAVALGIGLSAISLLPTVLSLGQVDTAYRDTQFFSEQPFTSLLSLVYPRAINDVGYLNSNPVEAYSYVGMAAIVLGLVALVAARHTGARRGIVTFLVIGTLLSASLVWHQGFWTKWMSGLPVFADNNSGRLRDLVAVFVCALAGLGFGAIVTVKQRVRVRLRMAVAAGAGLVALAVLTVLVRNRYQFAEPTRLWQDAAIGLVGAALVVAAILFRDRIKHALLGAVIVAVTASTAVSTDYFYPTVDQASFYPQTALISAAQQDIGAGRMLRVDGFLGSTATVYGLRTVEGHTFYPKTWADLLNTLDPNAFSGPGRTTTNPNLSALGPETGKLANPLLDRLGTTLVYATPGRPIPGDPHRPDGTAHVGDLAMGPPVTINQTQPLTLSVAAQPIRALRVFVAEAVRGRSDFEISATVHAADGTVIGRGSVNALYFPAGPLDIPIGGLDQVKGSGQYTIELALAPTFRPFEPSMTLLTVADGPEPAAVVIGTADDGLRLAYADSHGVLWQRLTALARIRWASHAIVEPDMMRRLTYLVDPATPTDTVLLSQPDEQPSGAGADLTVLTDIEDQVSVRVTTAGSGYLVIADGIQSGYEATIDGAPAKIVDADHAFGAVFVSPGTHVVTVAFTGVGMGIKLGTAVSAASLVALMLLTGGGWWWRRRSRRNQTLVGQHADDLTELEPTEATGISEQTGATPTADLPPPTR